MTDTSFEDDESSPERAYLLALFFKRRYIEEAERESTKEENDLLSVYLIFYRGER